MGTLLYAWFCLLNLKLCEKIVYFKKINYKYITFCIYSKVVNRRREIIIKGFYITISQNVVLGIPAWESSEGAQQIRFLEHLLSSPTEIKLWEGQSRNHHLNTFEFHWLMKYSTLVLKIVLASLFTSIKAAKIIWPNNKETVGQTSKSLPK